MGTILEGATGRLTTHILDTDAGRPAGGVRLALYRLDGPHRQLLRESVTNADGRCDEPLLAGDAVKAGVYELEFRIGDYFRGRGVALPKPAFLDVVPVRFGISDPEGHYHVPLIVSPYAMSTYRGS